MALSDLLSPDYKASMEEFKGLRVKKIKYYNDYNLSS
jgi:hypothetical protein